MIYEFRKVSSSFANVALVEIANERIKAEIAIFELIFYSHFSIEIEITVARSRLTNQHNTVSLLIKLYSAIFDRAL